jgi:hypothetical protein
MTRTVPLIATALLALTLGSCRHQVAPPKPHLVDSQSFVDLQPGWRIRVVVPRLRSGGYVIKSAPDSAGSALVVDTHSDLVGYEVDHYAITPRHDGGVRISFLDASFYQDGKPTSQPAPALDLLALMKDARYLRLVYLIRESRADHEMAMVSAATPGSLEELTRQVVERAECRQSPEASCWWVPKGVAIMPEEKRKVDGKRQWAPAR